MSSGKLEQGNIWLVKTNRKFMITTQIEHKGDNIKPQLQLVLIVTIFQK